MPFGDWLPHESGRGPRGIRTLEKGGAIRAGDVTSFSGFSTSSLRKIIKINSKSITYFKAAADSMVIYAFESMGGEIRSVGGQN